MSIFNEAPIMLLSMPGGTEWLFIILAIIILFGGKKIPELARGIGKGIRDFKDAKEGVKDEVNTGIHSKETNVPL